MPELTGADVISLTEAHIKRGGKIITPSDISVPIGGIIQWDFTNSKGQSESIPMKVIAASNNDEYQKEFKACFGKFSTKAYSHYYHIEAMR